MLPGTNHARIMARAGYDWICVDMEHGNIAGTIVCALVLLGEIKSPKTPNDDGSWVRLFSGALNDEVEQIKSHY